MRSSRTIGPPHHRSFSVVCSSVMSSGKHNCCCKLEFCQGDGGKATVRVPDDKRVEWSKALGLEGERLVAKDARITLAHFAADEIEASTKGSGAGGTRVKVRTVDGASPIQNDEEMRKAAKGAVPRLLRAEAENERHRNALILACCLRHDLEARISQPEELVEELQARSDDPEKEAEQDSKSSRRLIDYHILDGLSPDLATNLCGLRKLASLEFLYGFLNDRGAAENLSFYAGSDTTGGVKADGRRVVPRFKKLGGLNGLFFTLFVLRTGSTLRLTSTLFGVSETTGGRAFTTWLNFLRLNLQPVVHLPEVEDVVKSAPLNFQEKKLSSVIIVLDATEIHVDNVWQTDAAWATYSNYKGTTTGKILIGITPAGAICYISDLFGGRATDVELVQQSGLMDRLVEKGFSGQGMHVMADRGFNSIAVPLMEAGIAYVAPPSKRPEEEQFTECDAVITRDVANLRIHVERAIGAIKQWRILDRKVDSQQMDQIGSCFAVCGALVVLTRQPFASET